MSLLLHLQAVKYYVLYYEHTDSDLRRQSDFLQKASKPVSVSYYEHKIRIRMQYCKFKKARVSLFLEVTGTFELLLEDGL